MSLQEVQRTPIWAGGGQGGPWNHSLSPDRQGGLTHAQLWPSPLMGPCTLPRDAGHDFQQMPGGVGAVKLMTRVCGETTAGVSRGGRGRKDEQLGRRR